jgi:hypothetical protein
MNDFSEDKISALIQERDELELEINALEPDDSKLLEIKIRFEALDLQIAQLWE